MTTSSRTDSAGSANTTTATDTAGTTNTENNKQECSEDTAAVIGAVIFFFYGIFFLVGIFFYPSPGTWIPTIFQAEGKLWFLWTVALILAYIILPILSEAAFLCIVGVIALCLVAVCGSVYHCFKYLQQKKYAKIPDPESGEDSSTSVSLSNLGNDAPPRYDEVEESRP